MENWKTQAIKLNHGSFTGSGPQETQQSRNPRPPALVKDVLQVADTMAQLSRPDALQAALSEPSVTPRQALQRAGFDPWETAQLLQLLPFSAPAVATSPAVTSFFIYMEELRLAILAAQSLLARPLTEEEQTRAAQDPRVRRKRAINWVEAGTHRHRRLRDRYRLSQTKIPYRLTAQSVIGEISYVVFGLIYIWLCLPICLKIEKDTTGLQPRTENGMRESLLFDHLAEMLHDLAKAPVLLRDAFLCNDFSTVAWNESFTSVDKELQKFENMLSCYPSIRLSGSRSVHSLVYLIKEGLNRITLFPRSVPPVRFSGEAFEVEDYITAKMKELDNG